MLHPTALLQSHFLLPLRTVRLLQTVVHRECQSQPMLLVVPAAAEPLEGRRCNLRSVLAAKRTALCACPSLMELCVRKLCRDPYNLLTLSQSELPSSVWSTIEANLRNPWARCAATVTGCEFCQKA